MRNKKNQESGRSMIEMVGVLAVMGLITAGAFALISSAISSQKLSTLDDDVGAIVSGVRLLYNGQDTFKGLTNKALGLIGYANVKNPYGGHYYIQADTNQARFVVIVDHLTVGECNSLKQRKWPGGNVGKAAGTNNVELLDDGTIEYSARDRCAKGDDDYAAIKIVYDRNQEH